MKYKLIPNFNDDYKAIIFRIPKKDIGYFGYEFGE